MNNTPYLTPTSSSELLALHDRLASEAKELMARKNADYKGGTGDPFANFRMAALLRLDPATGVLLRMQDKMARVMSFLERGDLKVKEESCIDIGHDLINYSVILTGLLIEKMNENIKVVTLSKVSPENPFGQDTPGVGSAPAADVREGMPSLARKELNATPSDDLKLKSVEIVVDLVRKKVAAISGHSEKDVSIDSLGDAITALTAMKHWEATKQRHCSPVVPMEEA